MKISIERDRLLDGLQTVQNVVPTRNNLQILANALIKAENQQVTITATDLDMSVRCRVPAEVEEKGTTTLPVRRLLGIVRELPVGSISIDISEEDQAVLQSGASYFKIIGMPMRDFPPVPGTDGKSCYRIEQGAFREMLKKTAYASSIDETRRVLNGVLLAFRSGKLTMVATDGRRLALVEHEVEFPSDEEVEMILPTKAVNELMHILKDEGDLAIHGQKNQVVFEFGETMMSTKLIEGVYPNYRQVIPSACEERVTVEREALLAAMRRVSLVTTDKSNATRLTFGGNQLVIVTQTPEVGEARETMPIKYNGKQIEIIFNPEYVMDPLRNLEGDEVYIEMNDGHSPALIKCDLPFLYVLMPLRMTA